MTTAQEFDYIVIGGGTAGLVVANRLSANADTHVLILEAGEDSSTDPRSLTPVMFPSLLGSELDWNYATTQQARLNNRSIGQPQGRAVGGSSAINGLAFIPPSKTGIDAWARLGNKGWGWKDLEPYYTRFRNLSYPSDQQTFQHLGLNEFPQSRAGDGTLKASFTGTIDDPMPLAWFQSFKELGWTPKDDVFSGSIQGGFTCAPSIDIDTKTRSHSGTAYYAPVKNRPNLEMRTGAVVEKITFKRVDQDIVVHGVRWHVDGTTYDVHARKEVILAAGVYGTPKLLELSGIGRKDILEPLGIEVIVESPSVGRNLQDHLMTGISFEVEDRIKTLDDLRRMEPTALQAATTAYAESQTGPFSIGGIGSFAVMPVLQFRTEEGKAELQELLSENKVIVDGSQPVQDEYYDFVASTLSIVDDGSAGFWLAPALGSFGSDSSTLEVPDASGNFMTIGLSHLHPFSRGSSHISSSNPKDDPTINPNYFEHPLDAQVFVRHLTFIEDLAQSGPLSALIKDPIHGRRNHPLATARTLEEALTYVSMSAVSNWHPVGTAVMLPREKGGVVDTHLRVYGVSGLRIVDSSIIPIIPRGNPQTTVYAVAERGADIILGRV